MNYIRITVNTGHFPVDDSAHNFLNFHRGVESLDGVPLLPEAPPSEEAPDNSLHGHSYKSHELLAQPVQLPSTFVALPHYGNRTNTRTVLQKLYHPPIVRHFFLYHRFLRLGILDAEES